MAFWELPAVVAVLSLGNFTISTTKQSTNLNDYDIKKQGKVRWRWASVGFLKNHEKYMVKYALKNLRSSQFNLELLYCN